MKLAKNLSQVTLKMSKEEVTGRMGLGFVVHCMEHYGIKEMIIDEHGSGVRSNREIGGWKKNRGSDFLKNLTAA